MSCNKQKELINQAASWLWKCVVQFTEMVKVGHPILYAADEFFSDSHPKYLESVRDDSLDLGRALE